MHTYHQAQLDQLRDCLKAKEKELLSLTESLATKKQLETRFLKVTQDLEVKEHECDLMKSLLGRAEELLSKVKQEEVLEESD